MNREKINIDEVMNLITEDCNLCTVREALEYWNDTINEEVEGYLTPEEKAELHKAIDEGLRK